VLSFADVDFISESIVCEKSDCLLK